MSSAVWDQDFSFPSSSGSSPPPLPPSWLRHHQQQQGWGMGGPAVVLHSFSTFFCCFSYLQPGQGGISGEGQKSPNVGAIVIILSRLLPSCWLVAFAPYLVLQRPCRNFWRALQCGELGWDLSVRNPWCNGLLVTQWNNGTQDCCCYCS